MSSCCSHEGCELEALRKNQQTTLKAVLAINALMFVVEASAGLLAGSTALLADSLDMLGDSLVYGFSLYVVARGARWKAGAALFKGAVMAAFGVFVLGQAGYRMLSSHLPVVEAMTAVGLIALAANATCLAMLWRHRSADINMRSVWLCSRNDLIANVSVLVAAAGVLTTHSRWPDIAVGLAIAALFLHSAVSVLRESASNLRAIGTS
jgi:cation diffusion facilitator family transporter